MASVLILAALLLSGCVAENEQVVVPPPISMEHLHSIAIAPSGDVVFAATHEGLFQVPLEGGGEPQPMPILKFDAMGFTVIAESATLIASGHPPAGGNLGMIRSTNGGSTWEVLPGTEGVDFHVVAANAQSIYALGGDPVHIWASHDNGATWASGAAIESVDLALEQDGLELYATTIDGLQVSTDGGMTFRTVDGAPQLLFVETDPGPGLGFVGVDPSGAVWQSSLGGEGWSELGIVPGAPEGLALTPSGEIVVATDQGIYSSADASRWTTVWKRP